MRIRQIVCSLLSIIILAGLAGCVQPQTVVPQQKQLQQGGYLNYCSLYEPGTLNPLLTDVLATWEVGSLVFSGLAKTDDKGQWIPDLADAVPTAQNGGLSADGRTVVYHLRNNVVWHDGQPFSAKDVKFTWQFVMKHKTSPSFRDGYNKISAIDTPDQHTVVIHFKEYYPDYLTLFRFIMPEHILKDVKDIEKAPFNRTPVGTGPFKVKEWKVAESIVLEANTSYYMGKPTLDGINYKIVPDANIMLTQLKAGEIDIISNINLGQYDNIRSINNVQAVLTPGLLWEQLSLNMDNQVLRDPIVRQAIAMSIDKKSLVANVMKNAAVAAIADQPELSWGYNDAIPSTVYDVNAAANLLANNGWKQGADGIFEKNGQKLKFILSVPSGRKYRENTASVISQQLREAGMDVVVQLVEPQVFFDNVLRNRHFEAALFAWSLDVDPNHYLMWSSKAVPSSGNGYTGQNYAGWNNPEVDKLLQDAMNAFDQEAKKQDYSRIQELLLQDCPVVPLYFVSELSAVKNNVANYKPNPTTPAGNMWNAWQWGLTK